LSQLGARKRLQRYIESQKAVTKTDTPAETKSDSSSSSFHAPSASYSSQFKGDFDCFTLLARSELKETGNNIFSAELTFSSEHKAARSKIEQWLAFDKDKLSKSEALPAGVKISKIEVVFNPARYRVFLGELEKVEKRAQQAAFQPKLEQESSDVKERKAVLSALDAKCKQVTHNRQCKILRVW